MNTDGSSAYDSMFERNVPSMNIAMGDNYRTGTGTGIRVINVGGEKIVIIGR
jgi:hypothetical protein